MIEAAVLAAGLALPAQDTAGGTAWRPCDEARCTWVTVPRDYDRPNGPTFKLRVEKAPATGKKKGALLFNPGGPGGTGVGQVSGIADQLGPKIRKSFDVVSWDPRGIGESKPALRGCAQPWLPRPDSGPVDWTSVRDAGWKQLRKANAACQERNARVVPHMGTVNVAHDMDRIRRALGEKRITYWGMSYGTRIGYVYALHYPQRVRAMVLDGNIDPNGDYLGLSEGGTAPDDAFTVVAKHDPSLHRGVLATDDLLARQPIPMKGAPAYTRWSYLDIFFPALGSSSMWNQTADYNRTVEEAEVEPGKRDALVVFPDNSNEGGPFSVVNCLDYSDRPTRAQQLRVIRKNAKTAPVYGGSLTTDYMIGCAGLTVRPQPVPDVTRADRKVLRKVPVVVANATHDSATPLVWADRMHRAFPTSGYVKYRGGQHVIWHQVDSPCVNDPIDRFVLTLEPTGSRTCSFVK